MWNSIIAGVQQLVVHLVESMTDDVAEQSHYLVVERPALHKLEALNILEDECCGSVLLDVSGAPLKNRAAGILKAMLKSGGGEGLAGKICNMQVYGGCRAVVAFKKVLVDYGVGVDVAS